MYRRFYTKKQNYSKLFTLEEEAKLAYNTNIQFRQFVSERAGKLVELYTIYKQGGLQLKLF